MEKIYHIYLKNECVLHSIKEEDFQNTFNNLKNLVNILNVEYNEEDVTYEELTLNKEMILNSSH
jgi:hypothetical protein